MGSRAVCQARAPRKWEEKGKGRGFYTSSSLFHRCISSVSPSLFHERESERPASKSKRMKECERHRESLLFSHSFSPGREPIETREMMSVFSCLTSKDNNDSVVCSGDFRSISNGHANVYWAKMTTQREILKILIGTGFHETTQRCKRNYDNSLKFWWYLCSFSNSTWVLKVRWLKMIAKRKGLLLLLLVVEKDEFKKKDTWWADSVSTCSRCPWSPPRLLIHYGATMRVGFWIYGDI